jgi:hypothetical protein
LFIFSKSLKQDVYQEFKKLYEKLSNKEGKEIAYFLNNCEELISLDDCKPNSLIIFDDWVNIQQQHIIRDYFVRGRHKNISCVCSSQSYRKVDNELIGSNANILCIFIQNPKQIKNIYDEFVGSDFPFEKFKEICISSWNEDYGFLTINTTKRKNDGQ